MHNVKLPKEDIETTSTLDASELSINIHDPIWLAGPWENLHKIAATLPKMSWALVGGMLVQLHACIGKVDLPRVTTDIDMSLHIGTGSSTFSQIAKCLERLGYIFDDQTTFAYHFYGPGESTVDVMCPAGETINSRFRYRGKPLFGIPGAKRALVDTLQFQISDGESVAHFMAPTVKGALILKSAAFKADSRNPERHLEDGIVLLSLLDNLEELLASLSNNSRKQLRVLLSGISQSLVPWQSTSASTAEKALAVKRELWTPLGMEDYAKHKQLTYIVR